MKLAALFVCAVAACAADPKVIRLYPGVAPGSEGWTQKESEVVGPKDDLRRVSNVVTPTITVYLPDKAKANGTAMVICPGGGFRILAIDHEGHEVARYLNTLGVAAFVLKYRVMQTGDEGEKNRDLMAERRKKIIPISTDDGRAAVRLVRQRAAEFGVAPDRIGIMGFSAGGWVTADVALRHDEASKPNFSAPIYPAVPEDVTAPKDAAPMFIVHADDDKTVPVAKHSLRLYNSWKEAGVSSELHIYSKGGHGFGMRKKNLPVDTWPERLRDWLDSLGLLKR